jgi:hypothetical protein
MAMDTTALRDQFESFMDETQDARDLAARDRDYVDHIQWTDEEIATLEARNQAPVVINRLKVKMNFLTGAERNGRSDPRALPRTPQHEDSADAVTDGLRFVADNVDFDQVASACFEDKLSWGTEAAAVEVEQLPNGEFEIRIPRIEQDRFYYDPYSRQKDFSDAKFMGISVWMDADDAVDKFVTGRGKKADITAEQINALIDTNGGRVDGSTHDDQPAWVEKNRKRIRVNQHYYLEGGKWMLAYFCNETWIIKPQPSPYVDEFGEPECPIEAQSAYITRENERYGEARSYIWVQDEINHRRSKALHQLSVRQTIGDKGAVDDINQAKQELAKANGHVELNVPGARFEILENPDLTQGQLTLYQDAKNEIDSIGANSALSGEPDSGSLSGRAIQALQQGGLTELGLLFDGHRAWKRRIYRQIWNRIKQYWDAEKWVRVTDSEDNLRWVGLNQPVTKGELLREQAEAGSAEAQEILQAMLAIQDPALNEVVEVRNDVAEIDVDIIVTESPDSVTIQQEQFEELVQLAQSYGAEKVPFEVMLSLSSIRNKDEIKEMLEGKDDPPTPEEAEAMQAQQEFTQRAAEAEVGGKEADAEAKLAKARKDQADAEAQEIENAVVKAQIQGAIGA